MTSRTVPLDSVWPLSAAQQRIWYAHRADPGNPAYTIACYLDFRGSVDPAVFTEALRTTLSEADGLRVRFVEDGDQIGQVADAEIAPPQVREFASLSAAREWMDARLGSPFEPTRGPLLEFMLLRLPDNRFLWFTRCSHLLLDGYGFNLFFRRVSKVYTALAAGQPVGESPFGSFRDHLAEDAAYPDSDNAATARKYWAERLTGDPAPAYLAGGTELAHGVARSTTHLSTEAFARLSTVAREAEVRWHSLVFAAFAAYLARMRGDGDVLLSLAVTGRDTQLARRVPTMASNVVPLRVSVRPEQTWAELAAQVAARSREALRVQRYRGEDVRRDIGGGRGGLFFGPIVNVVPIDEDYTFGERAAALHNISAMPVEDLSLVCYPAADGGLRIDTDAHPEHYPGAEVEKHHRRVLRLLETLAEGGSGARVGDIGLLDEDERRVLLEEAEGIVHPVPHGTLPELFAARVAENPDAVAVESEHTTLSYRELDVRSTRLARRLAACGVGREVPVALLMERSAEVIVALLAVTKAGGAYVPLDSRYPVARMRSVLADVGAPLLLVDHSTHGHEITHAIPTLRAGDDSGDTEADLTAEPEPNGLAYVMYTSGSSGAPKGVEITHRDVVELASDRAWRTDAHRRVLFHSPHAFDASTYEIWVPLLSGGRVVVAPGEVDARLLRRYLGGGRVSALFLTTALFRAFAEDDPGCLTGAAEVWTGGEMGSPAAIRRVLDACPGTTVVSVYGPTETTTFATCLPIPPEFGADGGVPIGTPMSNRRAYVLDEARRLLPVGALGQLYLAGAGLARGYRGQPALTAEKFLPDPFGAPGECMYATGDLVRRRPGGALDFVGRVDSQVKIRGFRVELGDIETALTRHPAVSRAAVTVRDDQRLVAYVVPAEEEAGSRDGEQEQQVAEWREIYRSVYRDADEIPFGENFSGWNSSYTGEPIPLDEMREWRDATVAGVQDLHPKRVLEIGVGSGLLLAKLAPLCETYWGTDFSPEAIEALRGHLDADAELAAKVELRCQPADVTDGIPAGFFDTVILNSVVQYFPNAEYLAEVIRAAVGLLAPGGSVFVGDVRELGAQRTFRTAVELRRFGTGQTPASIRRAVERAVLLETELLVDPAFFTALAARVEDVDAVGVRVKRGRANNELTRYRYEAVLHKTPYAGYPTAETEILRWGREVSDLTALPGLLTGKHVRLTGVPNPRVRREIDAELALSQGKGTAEALSALNGTGTGPDPEDIRELGERLGFRVAATWAEGEPGRLDFCFDADPAMSGVLAAAPPSLADAPLSAYTNNPAGSYRLGTLANALGPYLEELLPGYMVPSAFVVLDRLPLNANGKVDRGALPAPAKENQGELREPRTPAEEMVARLFAELLGLPAVGVDDGFFELGGQSLLATRLISRVRAESGADVAIGDLFDAPTVAGGAERLGEPRAARPSLRPVPYPDRIPLSYAQQRLWFLYRLEGASPTYNIPLAVRLSGTLDRPALQAALGDVIARHESLRTVFPDTAGEPRQRILDPADAVPVLESAEATEEGLQDTLAAIAGHGFALAAEPPLRATLVSLDAEDHVLMLVLHHIAGDGWSLRPLGADLSAAYTARREGREPGWTPLPVQYADYTLWQRDTLGDPDAPDSMLGTQLAFWTEALGGLPEELPIPADHPRPARAAYRGGTVPFDIDAELGRNVAALAQRTGTTRFMVLQAAIAALLTRIGGGTDIPIGSPIAGRLDHALDDLVGCFVNTLVLRNDTSGDPGFTELLDRVRATDLAAYEHQDLPFEYLVERLNPARVGGRHPLFQVALSVFDTPADLVAIPGLVAKVETTGAGASRFDLAFICYERPGAGMDGFVEFSADLFSADTVRALASALVRLLRSACEDPSRRLSELELDEPARHREAEPVRVALPAALDLPGFATREGIGEEAVVFSGMFAVLSWYSGRDDVSLTVRENGRNSALAVEIPAAADFRALLDMVADELDRIRIGPVPTLPVSTSDDAYDVLVEYHRDGLPTDAAPSDSAHDLVLRLGESGGQLTFDDSRFDVRWARMFAAHFVRLVESMVADSGTLVAEVEPLTERERRTQLTRWSGVGGGYPEASLVELVRRGMALCPGAVAVTCGEGSWTYAELLERVETLAGRLVAQGVRPGEWVGLLFGRGLGQVEVMLAVLFAGAGYVPVDPAAPAERIAFVLADCEARWVLADDPAAPGLRDFAGRVLAPGELGGEVSPLPEVGVDSPAYCIYTSGTTGLPKGVVLTHRNVVRLVAADDFPFEFGQDDVWTLFHSYTFDFSVWELFCCLIRGGRLVVVSEEDAKDTERFRRLLDRERVTLLSQTPSAFANLLRAWANEPGSLGSLRQVTLGGEKVRMDLLAGWLRARPEVRTVNGYGITETGILTTWRRLGEQDVDGDTGDIGRPFPADRVYLLDVRGGRRLVPAGAVGELYLGGDGVAAGYVKRPELDAERFVPNPFGAGKLFRSGDLARYRPDGSLEFVGRADTQVKVRGFRVEPGEIELRLVEHPLVSEAAVLADEDRLVAFVCCTGEPSTREPEVAELRAHLASRVPEYMVPAEFRTVSRIPLTANGKRDDRALWESGAALRQRLVRGLETPTARRVAKVWSRFLDGDVTSGDASFFELGGHSLLAAKVIAAVRTEFGAELSLRELFENPRVQDFADHLDTLGSGEPDERTSPASGFQERIWLAEQLEPGTGLYTVPLAWRVRGRLDAGELATALGRVIERHEALRTRFVEREGRPRQIVDPPWTPTVDRHALAENEVTAWLTDEGLRPFDLATGPLLRVALLDTPADQILAITLHHLVWDMESATPFLRDLGDAYLPRHAEPVLTAGPPLTERERRIQLGGHDDSETGYPQVSLVELVRRGMALCPGAVAVTCGEGSWTYAELLERVETLAGRLVAQGVRPGEWVGLLFGRGLGQVEVMLAVLFAGAGYVPVDPASPAERAAFVLTDSEARWVLTDDPDSPCLREFTGKVLTSGSGEVAPLPEVGPDSPAYCIYTSGTTGRPKGVVISHRNVTRLVANDAFPFEFGQDDVWTLFHSYAFDFSVWELFGCLVHSGRLVVVTEEDAKDSERFRRLLDRERVTVLNQTPSAFTQLMRVSEPGSLDTLRYVIFGGENLRPRMLADWARDRPRVRLVNMYGITETTVHSTVRFLTIADLASDAGVIGVPIPATEIHLLDADGQVVPTGEVGEMYVGGAGVAMGYVKRPELAAERFVPNPFGTGKLFRSGDLARYRPDGALEFMGRADTQVKVRGFRVEPGEIEVRLAEHPLVSEAAVLAREDRLVAFVCGGGEPDVAELRAHLVSRVPEYMVPAEFRTVSRIPLTANGKRDDEELWVQGVRLEVRQSGGLATATEHRLARLWSDLLAVDVASGAVSFFELGGHSLLAGTLLARVRGEFGVQPPLRTLFENPRLRDFAARIDAAVAENEPLPDETRIDDQSLPASGVQERMWLAEQLEPDSGLYNVPLAWRVRGRLDPGEFASALAGVIERHEVLRTRFVTREGRLRQVVDPPWTPGVGQHDLTEDEVTDWLRAEAVRPFDPARGRLLRAALLDTPDGQVLAVTFHHLVFDGPSIPVLLAELGRSYRGDPVPLPGKQYRDFTAVQDHVDEAAVSRWVRRLRGAPANIPFREPAKPGPHGAVPLTLPSGLPERARRLQDERGMSWFMVVATALAGMLHRWTGREDVTFGFPVAGRGEDFADVVGPCLNTVVVRSRCGPDATVGELLDSVRDGVFGAIEDQEVPFEEVVKALNPPRRPGSTPYTDVTLNLNVLPSAPARLGEAELRPLVWESLWENEVKFGLTLTLLETGGRSHAVLSYRGDRFTAADVEGMARTLVRLLDHLPGPGDVRLGDLDLGVLDPGDPGTPVSPPGRQYRDFVAARAEADDAGLARWARRLRGAPSYLPFDAPAQPGPHGAVPLTLPGDLLGRVRRLQDERGMSWFMVTASALAALLHRWTGREDVTFGFPIANRGGGEFADVVGPCMNTVVVPSSCPEGTTVGELLDSVRDGVLTAIEDQEVPFEDVVKVLNPPRRLGSTPYVDVSLIMEATAPVPPTLGGLELRPLADAEIGPTGAGKFALSAKFAVTGGRLTGALAYRGDHFDAASADRLARLLVHLLEAMTGNPDRPLTGVSLLDAAELDAVRALESGSPAVAPGTVPQRLAARFAEHPDAVAVESARGVLDYRALDTRARALAARLLPPSDPTRGDDPVVALSLGRGEDFVVAMLAAWYAGCAFCPLDPGYPPARTEFLLRDLGAHVLVTDDPARAPEGVRVVTAEPDGSAPIEPVPLDPESTAYVLYTSGSTGQPKGVAVGHRGLDQLVRGHIDTFGLVAADRVSQLVNVSFDVAQSEIWSALCAGATLIPYERPILVPELAEWLDREAVTVVTAATPLAEALWTESRPPDRVRWMIFGGAALTHRPPADLRCRLGNGYGPTETTVFASYHVLDPAGPSPLNCVGRPVPGTRLHVLDDAGGRCPIGVAGEIHIAGAGVAKGYWRRPDLTAERFLSWEPGGGPGPMYRTGDLGRWLPDGTLEYLGRRDRQVKIRGFRVEPGEIETALRADPLVSAAVVTARPAENPALTAYLVPESEKDSAAVLARLKTRLPGYLVPGAVVWLDRLPLSANGKIDFAGLPTAGRDDLAGSLPRTEPRTELEQRIAAVWSSVLGIDEIGVHDNFFDLGGNSLLLSTLVVRLRGELGADLPIQRLFEHPTVHLLARSLDDARADSGDAAERAANTRRARAARRKSRAR